MFRLFKKKDPEREWALAEIKRLKGLILGGTEGDRATFSMALGIHWDMFVASQCGLGEFASQDRDNQMEYFRKYLTFASQARGSDPHENAPMDFIAQLLSAVILKDRPIEEDLKTFLRPYLNSGALD